MSTSLIPEEFLAEANVAVLATVDRRGRPHAAPVWYLYEDGPDGQAEIIVATGEGSQKHRNVAANPEVTLVVDRRTLPYYAVMVQGRAEIGPPLTAEGLLRLATRYLGEELARRYVAAAPDGGSLTLRIRPRKVISYDGRAGR
jgi:PPOX class probable F420-dependent enzyme